MVDDDAGFRRVAVMLLRRRGYELAGEASDLAGARALIDREQPDAALIDRNLPDGSGAELARALVGGRRGSKRIRVILMSSDDAGLNDPELTAVFVAKERLASIRLADYLGQPVDNPNAAA